MLKKDKVFFIGAAMLVITLTTLGLLAYNTKEHCYAKVGDVEVTECPARITENCPGAYTYHEEGTDSGTEFEITYRCPWKTATSTLGLIALSLMIVFYGVLVCLLNEKGRKYWKIFGYGMPVIFCLGAASFGLMIRDLYKGYQYGKNDGTIDNLKQGTYLACTIFMFIHGMLFLVLGCFSAEYHTELYGNGSSSKKTTPV